MNEERSAACVNAEEDDLVLDPRPEIPPVDFESTPINQWRHLNAAHRMCSELLLKSTGLTDVSQPTLLLALADCPDYTAESQKQLAAKLHVTPATVTVSLRSMLRSGYVTKQVDERDQRRKRILLTEKGREACRMLSGFSNVLDSEMFTGFSDAERAQCADYIQRMTDNLEETSKGLRRVIRKRQRIAEAQAEAEAEAAAQAARAARERTAE